MRDRAVKCERETGMEAVPAEEGRPGLWALGRIGPRGAEGNGDRGRGGTRGESRVFTEFWDLTKGGASG